jgi:hypothetical protein
MSRTIEHNGKTYAAEIQYFESCDGCIFMGKVECHEAPACTGIIFTEVKEKGGIKMNKPKVINKDGKIYTTKKETHFCDGCVFKEKKEKDKFSVSDCDKAPLCYGIIFTKVEEIKK